MIWSIYCIIQDGPSHNLYVIDSGVEPEDFNLHIKLS